VQRDFKVLSRMNAGIDSSFLSRPQDATHALVRRHQAWIHFLGTRQRQFRLRCSCRRAPGLLRTARRNDRPRSAKKVLWLWSFRILFLTMLSPAIVGKSPIFFRETHALLREEVGRMVSDSAEIDGEVHALRDVLVACEGRLGP
jgi:hypothetical protein